MKSRLLLLPWLLGASALRLAAEAPAAPTVIVSDNLESQSSATETVSDFDGHVRVTGTNLTLDCDHLRVISSRVGDPNAAIGQPTGVKYMLATGHVHIVQVGGLREATSGRAELLPEKNEIVLTDNPVAIDHGDNVTTSGDEMELLRDQRRIRVRHPRIVGPPMKDLGFAKPSPAPGGPDAPAAKP
jgi:lipopolysaccharide export system protein LptA